MYKRFNKKPKKPDYVTELAKEKRKNPTPGEKALWHALKRKNYFGYHIRRQAPFGRYIVDFYYPKKKLAIEVDGDSHIGNEEEDKIREDDIKAWQIKIIRFKEEEVLNKIKEVLSEIEKTLNQIKDVSLHSVK
jgi:very-short-patch-repair endonuclease